MIPSLVLLLACESGPDYGPFKTPIRTARATLASEPCNEAAMVNLADYLDKAGAGEEAVSAMKSFTSACKPGVAFEDLQVSLGIKRRDFAWSLEVADRRVAAEPSEPRTYRSRANIREQAGDRPGVVSDLRRAMLLDPKHTTDEQLKELALAQEQAGLPCEAWVTWMGVNAARRDLRGEANLATSRIQPETHCKDWMVTGQTEVKQTPLQSWWTFPVSVNGTSLQLGADTGSGITVIRKDAVPALTPLPADPWLFKNFQGTIAGQLARVDQFGIGSFIIAGVDVMLVDELPDGLQGMMGADLLSRISLKGQEKGDLWTVQGR